MARKSMATYSELHDLACRLRLDETAYRRAAELAGLKPDRQAWKRFAEVFLAGLGTALIVAGLAAFVAWNWAGLDRQWKFGLVEAGVLATAVMAWRFRLDTRAGRLSLLALGVLAGILLGLYGQVYQTGADPYALFLVWALLILPLCVIGRQAGLWLVFVILLNLTVILYYTQVISPPGGWWSVGQLFGPLVWLTTTVTDSTLASSLFGLDAIALACWEVGARTRGGWMRGRVFPRLVALLAFGSLLPSSLLIIAGGAAGAEPNLHLLSPALLAIAIGAAYWYYQHVERDLFILTLCALAVILAVTSLATRYLEPTPVVLLALALLVIAQVGGAAAWLRSVASRWEEAS